MESLIDKYRPLHIKDLVLPYDHSVAPALRFCDDPYPSAWLLHGRAGLGKSSLAAIMGALASQHPLALQVFSGPDVSIDIVRDLAATFSSGCLFGQFHTVIINESDSMPAAAQVRFLDILGHLKEYKAVIVCTSNDDLDSFEDRFISRIRPQLFTSQGLAEPARDWLLHIAAQENIPLTATQAARLVKLAKNNLRTALQQLELHGSEHLASHVIKKCLPVITAPNPGFQSGVEVPASLRPAGRP